MTNEKRIFDFSIWLIAVCVLAAMLTACNPYQSLQTATAPAATPAPTATITATTPIPTPVPRVCVVSTGVDRGSLNIRADAGTSYAVIGTLREGQALTLTDEDPRGAWINVTTSRNITGWINSKFCKGD